MLGDFFMKNSVILSVFVLCLASIGEAVAQMPVVPAVPVVPAATTARKVTLSHKSAYGTSTIIVEGGSDATNDLAIEAHKTIDLRSKELAEKGVKPPQKEVKTVTKYVAVPVYYPQKEYVVIERYVTAPAGYTWAYYGYYRDVYGYWRFHNGSWYRYYP